MEDRVVEADRDAAGASEPPGLYLVDALTYDDALVPSGFQRLGVRTDVVPAGGPIWEYDNAHLQEFVAFMEDRAEVERWRQTLVLYLGEVTGQPTPGWLGLHPTQHA